MMSALCAAGIACAALADEDKANGVSYTPGEGISFGEQPILSAEAGLSFDSKYMTYGVIDGKDPILTPSAQLTFLDWAYVGISALFDVTKGNGKGGEYGNRAGKWTTLDATVGLAHEFDLGEKLGTLSVDANYIYEYLRRHHSDMGDTQYLNLELGLSDGIWWIEPTLAIERDLMADDGTYVNFSLGHTFTLIGDEEEQVLTFTPSVGQGLGDKHRTRGYELANNHGGLMDTTIKGEFEWSVCDNVAITAYVAYSDYWFDRRLRDGAREYNGVWGSSCDHSWTFYGGVGLTLKF